MGAAFTKSEPPPGANARRFNETKTQVTRAHNTVGQVTDSFFPSQDDIMAESEAVRVRGMQEYMGGMIGDVAPVGPLRSIA